MSLPLYSFREPALMTPLERRSEIISLLSMGLSRFVADLPERSQLTVPPANKTAETSHNQLDAAAHQSVYAGDENT